MKFLQWNMEKVKSKRIMEKEWNFQERYEKIWSLKRKMEKLQNYQEERDVNNYMIARTTIICAETP